MTPEQVTRIIDDTYRQVQLEVEDSRIKSRTVIGGLIGMVLATLIGGALWGLKLIYGPPERIEMKIELILLFGLLLVCYGIIKLCTRQSWKNIIVLVCTILAVLQAVLIGGSIADLSKIL